VIDANRKTIERPLSERVTLAGEADNAIFNTFIKPETSMPYSCDNPSVFIFQPKIDYAVRLGVLLGQSNWTGVKIDLDLTSLRQAPWWMR
jgi:hypothetical protein